MALGARGMTPVKGTTPDGKPAAAMTYTGPINSIVEKIGNGINRLSGNTAAVHRGRSHPGRPPFGGHASSTPRARSFPSTWIQSGAIKMLPSFIFWCLFVFAFSYLGTVLPIWRFAQPVNYLGFWVTFLTIGLSALGRRRRRCPGAVRQCRHGAGDHLPDQDVHLLDAHDPGEGRGRQHHADAAGDPAAVADAVRDHRLRRHLGMARAGGLDRHGAATGV